MKEIEKRLVEMQEAILEDYETEHTLSMNSVTNDIGDDLDHASEERERELHQLLCDRDQEKLINIKTAFAKIENNTYGLCEECETKIPKARLMALPFTQLCVECKTDQEISSGVSIQETTSSDTFDESSSSETFQDKD